MSKIVSFELADEVYEALQQMAAKAGRPLEDLALEWLAKYRPKPRPPMSEEERKAAWERLQRDVGTQSLG
jgi:predicted transcriptional regulator